MFNLRLIRGDTPTYEFTITRDGIAVDLTGATVTFTVRETYDGELVFERTVGDGITVTTPSSGVFQVQPSAANTSARTSAGRFVADAEIVESDGTITTEIGNIIFALDVTT
jgi:hypothetical protein